MIPLSSSKRLTLQIVHLYEQDGPNPVSTFASHRLTSRRLATYAYLLLYSLRCLALAYTLNKPYLHQAHLRLDPTMANQLRRTISGEPIIACSLGALGLFTLAVDGLFFLRQSPAFWFTTYEALITNQKAFWKCNRGLQMKHSLSWRHPLRGVVEFGNQIAQIWNCKTARFTDKKLITAPYLTAKHRSKMVLLSLIYDAIEMVVLIVVVVILVAYFLLLYYFLYNSLSLFPIYFLVDNLTISWVVYQCMRQLFLLGHSLMLIEYANLTMFQGQAKFLLKTVQQFKLQKASKQPLLRRRLIFYLATHWNLVRSLIRLNDTFLSAFFAAFSTTFPVSVCFQAMILTRNLSSDQTLIMWSIVTGIALGTYLVVTNLCRFYAVIYASPPLLYQVQPHLGQEALHQKLTCQGSYEQMHRKGRFTFTVGALARITKRGFLELILLDLAYILNFAAVSRRH